jgi:hypothetical protein
VDIADKLLEEDDVRRSPVARELAVLLTRPVGRTSAGYPYLEEPAWTRFRDWVPHTLGHGQRALDAANALVDSARGLGATSDELANLEAAAQVVQQVVFTAAVTAPPDLWLLRYVLNAFDKLGLSERLLRGEHVEPGDHPPLLEDELRIDLAFLLARGLLLRHGAGLRLSDHESAARALRELPSIDDDQPASLAAAWARALTSEASDDERARLRDHAADPPVADARVPGRWAPTPEEIELGYRLVPLVLGLRSAGRVPSLVEAERVDATTLFPGDEALGTAALSVLRAAGVTDDGGALGAVGRRVLERGPGPFGIIEAYHGYMAQLPTILKRGRGEVWVERRANVDASQDANRRSFERANDALDRFCADTGFSYEVFIEHAIGRGEATRQRFSRDGDARRYVGADLEDAAIDAAIEERDAGHLPAGMVFVREADIGIPDRLLDGLSAEGLSPDGAVMIVGNGFHEVREQTDERMTAVLAGYERAGIVLLFTEETALAIEDLLATAWNTYHAGFKYVHERSGQALRPAVPRPPSALEGKLPMSWSECAERAGYVRAEAWSRRSRTVYPYTPVSGHNPSISVNHFFVPARIARELEIERSR